MPPVRLSPTDPRLLACLTALRNARPPPTSAVATKIMSRPVSPAPAAVAEAVAAARVEPAAPAAPTSPFAPAYFRDQKIPVVADAPLRLGPLPFNAPKWLPTARDRSSIKAFTLHAHLTLELASLAAFLARPRECVFLHDLALDRLRAAVSPFFPEGTQIRAFGSSVSPVASVSSDLDVGILPPGFPHLKFDGKGARKATELLRPLLPAIKALAKHGTVEPVLRHGVKVPIVKYVDRVTNLEVDLSIQWEGFTAVDLVDAAAATYGANLTHVVLTLKALLSLHSLNVARHGGVNGFCTLSLVVAILHRLDAQGIPVRASSCDPTTAPGLVFLTVLHFLGFVLDPQRVAIDAAYGGMLFDRTHPSCNRYAEHAWLVTSIRAQDPPENVGRCLQRYADLRDLAQFVFLRIVQVTEFPRVEALLTAVFDVPDAYRRAYGTARRMYEGLMERDADDQSAPRKVKEESVAAKYRADAAEIAASVVRKAQEKAEAEKLAIAEVKRARAARKEAAARARAEANAKVDEEEIEEEEEVEDMVHEHVHVDDLVGDDEEVPEGDDEDANADELAAVMDQLVLVESVEAPAAATATASTALTVAPQTSTGRGRRRKPANFAPGPAAADTATKSKDAATKPPKSRKKKPARTAMQVEQGDAAAPAARPVDDGEASVSAAPAKKTRPPRPRNKKKPAKDHQAEATGTAALQVQTVEA
ncbi:hypothetical protein AMAG_12095 [Allomyces macrogynus ATCC 38327]|uniref:Poly(A) RNA polymerase mitochondrial-like central palm domain-containing protein n=1 Tax=Allomyces macrogynus (strain ATCC 38327) TaxID=578462 RepID=A0A0L0SYL6_ALLM3|nr:hypothetical protein AMAG_12095 [Allomyces macrogynus ATCC 38327]|eukprot:KNE67643.1 hypothetical protein AMAG_12095 [Allomyces macrogynus ATCC 38327]